MKKFSLKNMTLQNRAWRNMASEGFRSLLDLFYPRLCIGCGDALFRNEKDLCLACLLELPLMRDNDKFDNFIEERFYGRLTIEHATSFLYYEKETVAQEILHEIKYHGNKELGRRLGAMLGAKMVRERFPQVDALVPVPLHPNKQKSRGYNQSEWIAKGLSEVLKVPVWTDVLERVVENTTQTKKDASQRWENVKGIFRLVNRRSVDGKHLLLVDDVLTTGATIEACAMPLLDVPNVRMSIASLAAVY